MWRRRAIVFFSLFVLTFLFEIELLLVRSEEGDLIYIALVQEGDLIELGHINSIYEKEVKEILKVKDGHMELVDVLTESYGVKEYYLLDDNIGERRWKTIQFRASRSRGFSLKVKSVNLPLEKYEDRVIRVEVKKGKVFPTLIQIPSLFRKKG